MSRTILLFAASAVRLFSPWSAVAVTIDTVWVGDPGNAGDVQPQGTFGAVAYNYRIGTYEVTIGQYTEFLNAVATTDMYDLYNEQMCTDEEVAGILQSGAPGSYIYSVIGSPNRPVTHVGWGDAARFVNWLHNGQPTGLQNTNTTENGAYSLNGATDDIPTLHVTRNAGAKWFLPSENEWYKAAYYQPSERGGDSDSYWAYPMRSNDVPHSDQPPGGTPDNTQVGNFYRNDGLINGYDDGYAVSGTMSWNDTDVLTVVGAYASSPGPYGTFDQGGNVWEWDEVNIGGFRGVRGGSWSSDSDALQASIRSRSKVTNELRNFGFRVAAVPEPSTLALAGLGLLGAGLLRWRRKR